jgi:tetratricopeptide (TPR) repeat protein
LPAPTPVFDPRVDDLMGRLRAQFEPLPPPREGPIMVKVEPKPVEKPLAGQEAGKFRPIGPDERDKARQPIKPDPLPKPRADEGKEEVKPLPLPEVKANPKAEAVRLIMLGREAYADQGYGRALQRLQQASGADPKNAEAHLLLGQALFALGKYREAVREIQAGLVLNPGWAKMPFRPLDLYGPNVADYAEQMFALDTAVTAQPNDADLLFLLGYQRWFDGRRDEAGRLFQKANRLQPNNPATLLFLNQLPGLPIV